MIRGGWMASYLGKKIQRLTMDVQKTHRGAAILLSLWQAILAS